MRNKNRIAQTIFGTLVAFALGVGLRAQEPPPPPPPPPPGVMGADVFVFNRMEEASSEKPVKGAPYSAQAVTEFTQTLSDGNQIHRKTAATLYRDSEGRTRREQTLGGFGPWSPPENSTQQIIRISDPTAGASYILNPAQRTAQKLPAMQGGPRMMRQRASREGGPPSSDEGPSTMRVAGPPPPAGGEGPMGFERHLAAEGGTVQTESLGSQVIEGVQADGTRTTMTIPAGRIGNDKPIQIVTERWYSNQLQAVVLSKRSDPRVGQTVYRLTSVTQAEPAAALFQVPSEYTIHDVPQFRRHENRVRPTPNANPEPNPNPNQ